MLQLIQRLPRSLYPHLTFLVATTDHTSVAQIHREYADQFDVTQDRIIKIPRSREVGQAWSTSCATTVYAMLYLLYLIGWKRSIECPNVILANGPGTCIPICWLILVLKFFGLVQTRIIFCESFARVQRLSLSGKIAYYSFADRFIVHWPELVQSYPTAEYLGVVY